MFVRICGFFDLGLGFSSSVGGLIIKTWYGEIELLFFLINSEMKFYSRFNAVRGGFSNEIPIKARVVCGEISVS